MRIFPFLLLLVTALFTSSCAHDGRFAEVGAAVNSRVDLGVGVTKSTDGWWYIGGKVRGKPGKGSDARLEEREPPYIYPLRDK